MRRFIAVVAAGALALVGLVHCSSPVDAPHSQDAAPDVEDGGDGGVFDSGQFKVPDTAPPDQMRDVHVDVVPAPC